MDRVPASYSWDFIVTNIGSWFSNPLVQYVVAVVISYYIILRCIIPLFQRLIRVLGDGLWNLDGSPRTLGAGTGTRSSGGAPGGAAQYQNGDDED